MQIIKNNTKYILALVGMILLLSSCEKEYESIESIDDAKIKTYIQQNNVPAIKDPSGFYYQVLEQGTGEPLLDKDSVFYNVTVKSLTGTTYVSPTAFANEGNYLGYTDRFIFNNTRYLIPAIRLAMGKLNRGGKVRAILPSYLAFGKNGSANIPPNEVVVVEISVLLEKSQYEIDDKTIQGFIAAKGLTGFTKHPSRVYQNISVMGSGATIGALSTITVKYKGRLLSGTQFDESGSTDHVTVLADLIAGWRKVLLGVPKGTKMRILIPSDLAYRDSKDQPSIPPYSVLDFDIEIVDVVD